MWKVLTSFFDCEQLYVKQKSINKHSLTYYSLKTQMALKMLMPNSRDIFDTYISYLAKKVNKPAAVKAIIVQSVQLSKRSYSLFASIWFNKGRLDL